MFEEQYDMCLHLQMIIHNSELNQNLKMRSKPSLMGSVDPKIQYLHVYLNWMHCLWVT
jgi:hypothetical protein